jgi:hypothetical protein
VVVDDLRVFRLAAPPPGAELDDPPVTVLRVVMNMYKAPLRPASLADKSAALEWLRSQSDQPEAKAVLNQAGYDRYLIDTLFEKIDKQTEKIMLQKAQLDKQNTEMDKLKWDKLGLEMSWNADFKQTRHLETIKQVVPVPSLAKLVFEYALYEES